LKPSETQRGQRWSTNFDEPDREIARLLLDSVEIADPGEVRQTLAQELTSSVGIEPPAVLLPVLSIEDITMEGERRPMPTAYVDFDPGQRIPMTPGSEAMAGQLIRDFAGDRGRRKARQGWVHPAAPIEELRDDKIRTLVLMTDVIGSGTQAAEYAETFTRNATLRSWRSFKLSRLIVLAYAATPGGAEFVRDCRAVDELIYARPARSFSSAPWTSREREQVSELCLRYLPRRERRNALGFGGQRRAIRDHQLGPEQSSRHPATSGEELVSLLRVPDRSSGSR
jgi:hypothetical protein